MWIYYYATFGPGHQSNDYDFKWYSDDYDREDIKDDLFRRLDLHYDIVLRFWEVEAPPAEYVEGRIKSTKSRIKYYKKHLKMLEGLSCFLSSEEEGEDKVLIKNIKGCIIHDLLTRLHKAGFMYSAEDISNWRRGKKKLCEPSRSKILRIMRRTEKY